MTPQSLLVKAIGYALVAGVWALLAGLPLAWWLGGLYGSPWPWLVGAGFGVIATGAIDLRAWMKTRTK
tara:strand:+ start:1262 stop:1465 length:204 start_codon:yes stop_codon:yes gene_type:complete